MSQVKLDQPEDCILDLRDLRTNGRADLYGASCGIKIYMIYGGISTHIYAYSSTSLHHLVGGVVPVEADGGGGPGALAAPRHHGRPHLPLQRALLVRC